MSAPVLIALVVVGLYLLLIVVLVVSGRREQARAVAGFIPDCAVLMRRLVSDARVSRRCRWVLWASVAYLALPVDLVPDFLPVVGQMDDAVVVALAVRMVLRDVGTDVVERHWPGPPASFAAIRRIARFR